MTNNTTAALTDDEREKLIDLVDRLIRNPDAVTAKDCIIGNDVRTVQWIAEHTRALLTSPRAAGLPGHVRFSMESTARWLEGGCDPLAAAKEIRACLAKLDAAPAAPVAEAEPIPMLLFCPRCGTQHIDAPEDAECDGEVVHSAGWSNPPHRSHLCHACDCIWRPADVATVGVASIKTHGKADTWEGMAGVTSMPAQAVAADGAQLDEDRIDWIANAHCPGGTAYPVNVKNAIREALREARAAVSPATADQSASDCKIDFGPGATLQPGPRVTFADGMREAARLIQLWQSMQPAYRQLHSGYNRDASRIIAFWPGRLRECADDAPATAEPCAHDYVRSDRVCTECGEKTATADVTLPYENVLHDLIRKIVPGLDSGDILNDARTAINAVTASTMTDAQIDAVWENIDTRGSSLYEPHAWEIEKRRRFARAVATGVPVSTPATADERTAPMSSDVRAYLENLAKAGSEPLNSAVAYKDKASRMHFMVEVRNGARALLARASQAAAPAEVQGGQKFDMRTALSTAKLRIEQRSDDEQDGEYWSAAQSILAVMKLLDDMPEFFADVAAAPAEAREPVGRFDKSLNQIRWRDGLVNADFADRQPFYTYPVSAPADAGEAVAKPRNCSGTPESCPDNEGCGCHCSNAAAQGAQGGKGGEA
ncbi:hypothetical protein [Burkholderia gladioli]|uniref:hypothetical protein n=1 Tax=Burkholderia gladioli TaxID=28095 RepID=UPI0016401C58|nr:hypothetical protein [Burkholderia gladioli]